MHVHIHNNVKLMTLSLIPSLSPVLSGHGHMYDQWLLILWNPGQCGKSHCARLHSPAYLWHSSATTALLVKPRQKSSTQHCRLLHLAGSWREEEISSFQHSTLELDHLGSKMQALPPLSILFINSMHIFPQHNFSVSRLPQPQNRGNNGTYFLELSGLHKIM